MNPVDHVSTSSFSNPGCKILSFPSPSLTVVVTINILVKLPPFHDSLPKVKRLVSLPPGELVCCAVPRRQRIKGHHFATGFISSRISFRLALKQSSSHVLSSSCQHCGQSHFVILNTCEVNTCNHFRNPASPFYACKPPRKAYACQQ